MDCSSIDWSATGSMLGGIAGVLTALATIGLVLVGASGVNAWRRQLKETRQLEAAEDLLAASYEAIDACRYIMSPANFAPTDTSPLDEDPLARSGRLQLLQVQSRISEKATCFSALRARNFVARARLGDVVYEPCEAIARFPSQILHAAEEYAKSSTTLADARAKYLELPDARATLESAEARQLAAGCHFYTVNATGGLGRELDGRVLAIEEPLLACLRSIRAGTFQPEAEA